MLSQQYLKECFDYNPDTGDLIWKKRPRSHFNSTGGMRSFNARFPNEIAGFFLRSKKHNIIYRNIRLKGKSYLIHRVIWMLVYGKFPESQIDHINRNGLDNRILNLREVTASENCKNRGLKSSNKTGITGVYFHKLTKKWAAQISFKNGRNYHIGLYVDFFEACCARKAAEYNAGFHENYGREI